MNVGYTRSLGVIKSNPVCPLCGDNVYGSKYGGDFTCVNKECLLNSVSASTLVNSLKKVIEDL